MIFLENNNFLDLKFFQILQDKIAEEFGIGSIITDINGLPLTKPSNFSEFCINYTRRTSKGFEKCMLCDAYGGIQAKTLKKPVVYRCHAGLIDFASPIIINESLVGCFLGGQVLSEAPDFQKIKSIAKDIGVDENIYIEALKKVKIIPYEKIEYIANFLYEISFKLSNFTSNQNIGLLYNKESIENIEKFEKFMKNINFSFNKNKFSKNIDIDEKTLIIMNENMKYSYLESKEVSEILKNIINIFKKLNIKIGGGAN